MRSPGPISSVTDLEDFFENGTIGLHLVAADGTIVRANRADYERLGYSVDEYVGQPIMKFHADEEVIADILTRLAADETLDRYPARLRAKDGSIRHVEISSSACFEDGQFANTRCFTIDVTDRVLAQAELHDVWERFSVTYENTPAGIAETDDEGRFLKVNRAFEAITGHSRDELAGITFLDITHPEYRQESKRNYEAQVRGELDVYEMEKRYIRKDGGATWVKVSASAVRGPDGEFRYGIRMVEDITERKKTERQRKLLLDELNHRVKNTLATVQALVAHTVRTSQSAEDFRRRFEPRLLALSAAHDQLTKNDWQGANLRDIVEAELRAHEMGARTVASGPDVMLLPRVALSLSMVLHELTTNALKYGALSIRGGRVTVEWSVDNGGDETTPSKLVVCWTEKDGPSVRKPDREGFGSRLLKVTAAELRGEMGICWSEEGLEWRIEIPLTSG